MSTSLQNIVTFNDRYQLQKDIQELFKPKMYPRFQLQEFYSSQLYEKHEQFRFFVDILEEWNRKIVQEEVPNHFNALFQKNVFIFNSLRNSIMQPSGNSHRLLGLLYSWFTSTRNRTIRPIVKKKNLATEQDEDWLVRNTFKSNLPSEIDTYHRRIVCKFKEGREQLNQQQKQRKPSDKPYRNAESWGGYQNQRDLQKRHISRIQNDVVRFEREKEELLNVQKRWKIKKARQEKENTKNFYRTTFSSGKLYFPKKKNSEKQQAIDSRSYYLKRVNTSQGYRRSKGSKDLTQMSGEEKKVLGEETNRKSQNSVDKFDEFQMLDAVRLSDVAGIGLMENPLQTKLKKKKRVK